MTGIITKFINPIIFAAMFKQITALVLVLAFLLQTFSSGFMMLNYYINTASFAKNCVNKARPKMHCNGKCQMMRKLQQQEKKEQQMPEQKFAKKFEVLSSKSFYGKLTVPFSLLMETFSRSIIGSIPDISGDFFHPPQS